MNKKIIILKSIIKFFVKNIFSVFGIIILVLFSSATFSTLNNATNNLNDSYTKIVQKGNLHDFVINERFTLGFAEYHPLDPKYIGEEYSFTLSPTLIEEPYSSDWTNSYKIIYNDFLSWQANGEIFHEVFTMHKNLFENTTYTFFVEQEPIELLDNEMINLTIENNLLLLERITSEYMPSRYIEKIESQTPTILRNFKSINIPTNKQGIFYKIIEENKDNNIDKIVLFDGNNFSNDDLSFSGLFSIYADLTGDKDLGIEISHNLIDILSKTSWNNVSYLTGFSLLNDYLQNNKGINPWTNFNLPINLRQSQQRFKNIIEKRYFEEKGSSIIFNLKELIPVAGYIDNKTSYEAIVTPQYLKLNNKQIFSYEDWILHKEDSQEEFINWYQSISDRYKVFIDNTSYLIIGSGLSPDFIYPVMSNERIIPDVENETIVYTNNSGFLKIQDAFRNAELETMILGDFLNTTSDKSKIINIINVLSREWMDWPSNIQAAFLADDTSNVMTSATIRVIYIPNIMKIITLISYFLTSFITIVAIIIIILFIKRFIDLNKVNLGILQANGYKKSDIILPIIFCLSSIVLIGSSIGFNLGLILQIPTMLIFQGFWTLPFEFSVFNGWVFFIFIIALVLLYTFITFLISIFSLRGDNVNLIKSDAKFKDNFISFNSKRLFKNANPLSKFRISLASHSISKLLLLSIMSSLVMVSLMMGSSTFGKFEESIKSSFNSKRYKYDLELYTPTRTSGQYYAVPLDNMGMTLLKGKYINETILTKEEMEDPLSILLSSKDLENSYYSYNDIVDYNDPSIKTPAIELLQKNGNFHLPSILDLARQKNINFLQNLTQNKALLNVPILTTNPWEIASRLMPINQKNYANNSFQEIFSQTTIDDTSFKTMEKINNQWTLKDSTFSETIQKITKDSNSTSINAFKNLKEDGKYLEIDKKKIMGPSSIISSEFMIFILNIFKNKNYYMENYNLNYNKIPILTNNVDMIDETYTNVSFKTKNINGEIVDDIENFDLKGIKSSSEYISLIDDNNKNLILDLLSYEYDPLIGVPIIVNQYSAKKMNLKIGSTINSQVLNHIDRHTNNIISDSKMIVIGINNSFYENEFYTLQNYANQLTGMDAFKISENDGEPFNGILSVTSGELSQINNTLSSYSPSGLYIGDDKITSSHFLEILSYGVTAYDNLIKASEITNIPLTNGWEADKFGEAKLFQSKVISIYGNSVYVSMIDNMIPIDSLINLTNNISTTSQFIQIFILVIIVIVSITIITLIMFMLIADSLKIAGMIKILGLKNMSNALSFASIYSLAITLGIILAIPVAYFLNMFYINLIFNTNNILLVAPILISDFLISTFCVLLLFSTSFLINWRRIKKLDLTKAIK